MAGYPAAGASIRSGPGIVCAVSGVAFALLLLAFIVAAGDWLAVARGDVGLDYLCKPLFLLLLIGVTVEIEPANREAWAWFVVALAVSLVGDVLLMIDRDQFFLGGLTCFVTAHLAYLAGMLFLGIDAVRVLGGVALAAVVMLAVGRKILGGVKERQPALVGPVKTYIYVMTAMAVAAFAVGRPVGIMGAGLFSAADAMGGWNRFVRPHPVLPWATTVAYHLGQAGLVLSLV